MGMPYGVLYLHPRINQGCEPCVCRFWHLRGLLPTCCAAYSRETLRWFSADGCNNRESCTTIDRIHMRDEMMLLYSVVLIDTVPIDP
jgi:hypothetical protein